MVDSIARLVVDCSVVVKWKIPTEDHAAAAEALLMDWEYGAVEMSVPHHFPSEVISAFLRAYRRDRITADEAREAIRDLLALPFVLCDVAPLAERAFAIVHQHQLAGITTGVARWDKPNIYGSISSAIQHCAAYRPVLPVGL